MDLGAFKTQAQAAHGQIIDAAGALNAELESKWFLDSGVEAATITAINSARWAAAKLAPGGSVTLRVLSGEKTPAWWEEQARHPRELIATASKNLGESVPSWRRIKGEVIDPTAAEFVTEVKGAVEVVDSLIPSWVPWAIGGGLALGVVVLATIYLPRGD